MTIQALFQTIQVKLMLSNDYLHSLSAKLADIFPAASAVRKDIETSIYTLLQSSFDKLNLVTREEFDSQLAILKRSEQTIKTLEDKIDELEAKTEALKADDQASDN